MKNSDIVERLGTTRARIEAAVKGPSVLVVTSALETDGSSVLASALAESLVRARHSVLLVCGDGSDDERRKAAGRVPSFVPRRDHNGMKATGLAPAGLSVIGMKEACSLDAARAEFAAYREQYKFTIIDSPAAAGDGSACALANAADFVLVAFEEGRAARTEDRELVDTLKSTGAKILGVVTIDAKTIRSFVKEPVASPAPTLVVPAQEEAPQRKSVLSSMLG
ncbi:MAG: hypothetical protein ACLPYS_11505 [Vulcanimicrobiaceae bacterium]